MLVALVEFCYKSRIESRRMKVSPAAKVLENTDVCFCVYSRSTVETKIIVHISASVPAVPALFLL